MLKFAHTAATVTAVEPMAGVIVVGIVRSWAMAGVIVVGIVRSWAASDPRLPTGYCGKVPS